MLSFIAKENVERYRRLLETEQNVQRRSQIERLLAEAIAKLDEMEKGKPQAPSEHAG